MRWIRRAGCALLSAMLTLGAGAAFAENQDALFAEAAAALKTPAAAALEAGTLALRPGDSLYHPALRSTVVPYDQLETTAAPAVQGAVTSSDPAVVRADADGLLTALTPGTAEVSCQTGAGTQTLTVIVTDDAIPLAARNFAYVAQREFTQTARARLPKYNQYAKWYYGKRKEVGWCSVFTIWCANASGNHPVDESAVTEAATDQVLYFREGQVGNQYDGFQKLGRFTGEPRVGYVVLYGDLSNSYRTTHIGIVVGAEALGAGLYRVTTVEGNMSNTVKSYCYLYDSNLDNHTVGVEKGKRLQENMSVVPKAEQTDPLVQYALQTDHWCVFGFGASWL